jgi:hypothetical protein
MTGQIHIDEALGIIREIRGIVGRVQANENPEQAKRKLKISFLIQTLGCLICLFFTVVEMYSGQWTRELALSVQDPAFRKAGLLSLAAILVTLVAGLYILLLRSARQEELSFNNYLEKNFPKLLTLNFFSDLLVKYSAVSAVVLALHPELIPPLLFIFIADYLLQGRFFILSFPISLTAAALMIFAGALQFLSLSASMLWPLLAFTLLCLTSAAYLAFKMQKLEHNQEVL